MIVILLFAAFGAGAIANSWNITVALGTLGIAGIVSAGVSFGRLPAVRRME